MQLSEFYKQNKDILPGVQSRTNCSGTARLAQSFSWSPWAPAKGPRTNET